MKPLIVNVFKLSLLLGVFGHTNGHSQPLGPKTIGRIELIGSSQIDRIRVVETLGIRVGDVFRPSLAAEGINRLAETQLYRSVSVQYLPESFTLQILVELAPILEKSILRLTKVSSDTDVIELENDLRGVIGVAEGEILNLDFLSEVKNRLQKRLMDRGFEAPNVVMSFEGGVSSERRNLVASINLGERSKIQRLKFKNFTSGDLQSFFKILKSRLENRGYSFPNFLEIDAIQTLISTPLEIVKNVTQLDQASGAERVFRFQAPMDWVAVTEATTEWAQFLRDSNFFDVELKAVPNTLSDRTYEIEFSLNKGKKFNIQTTGNTAFWERDLRSRILDRPIRLGVPLSIADSVSLLERTFKAAGYKDIKITYQVEDQGDERKIEFAIQEGPRFYLGEIEIEGIDEPTNALIQPALTEWLAPFKSPFHKIYFDEESISRRQSVLINGLRRLGFLQARILNLSFTEPSKDSNLINATLNLQLGPQFRIRNVEVSGNILFTDEELDKFISISPGDLANLSRVQESMTNIIEAYRELGFLRVTIDGREEKLSRLDLENNLVDIEFSITPGPQLFLANTVVGGNSKTNTRVITRVLEDRGLKEGGEWSPSAFREAEQDLLGLGIFSSVSFEQTGGRILSRPLIAGDGIEKQEKDVRVRVIESIPGSIEFGPGYRSELGLVGSFDFKYRNIGGWNRGLNARAQVSRKLLNYQFLEQRYSITFLEPYVLNLPLRLRLNVSYEKDDQVVFTDGVPQKGFNSEETSFTAALEKEFNQNIRIVHRLYELALPRIFDVVEGTSFSAGSEKYRISSFGTTLTIDTRNNFFNPTRGWFSQSSYDFASPFLGGDREANFFVVRQTLSRYFPIGNEGAVIAFAVLYSRIIGLGESSGLPENRRLVLGGRTSIRSFDEKSLRFDEAGVMAQDTYELKVEFRQPLLLDLGIAFFWDIGEVRVLRSVDSNAQLKTGLKSGVGFGLRYSTPVGPIALDFAFNPERDPEQDPFRLQFSIGSF